MRNKKFRNRPAHRTLASVDQAVKDAYDRGDITQDVYDGLVRKGLEDMREKDVPYWADAVVVEEVPPPPVEECMPEEAPPSPITVSTASTCPPPELEEEYHGECKDDESLVPPILSEDAPTAGEATDAVTPEAHQEPPIPDGSAITHCFGCLRLDVVEYAERKLPAYLWSGGERPPKAVVMVLCGTCRKDSHFSRHSKIRLDGDVGESWCRLRLRSQFFEASPAMQTVRYLLGGGVSILAINGGVFYREVDRIVRELGPEDRVASIDVAAFERGQRDHLRLPYLRGGLITGS